MRRALVLLLLLAAGVLAGLPAAPATAEPRSDGPSAFRSAENAPHHQRRPVFARAGFADPSVVRWRGGYVGVATGPLAPRSRAGRADGGWRKAGTALQRRPRWASSRSVWAGDVVRVGPRWLLYFAAPVRGLGEGGRCIGVATARRPTGRFHAVGRTPLVCPERLRGPRARGARPHGLIDPEGFRRGKDRYLLYRTQGTPSSIRLVRLTRNGMATVRGARGRQLVRAPGIVENPSLVQRGRAYYLLTSEGYYGDCGYRTTWRRSTDLWRWHRSRPRVLMDTARTGLCGPGGADVVDTPAVRRGSARRAMVVLHGWSCPRRPGRGHQQVCPDRGADYQKHPRWGSRRALYAAWLWWRHGRPRVTSFVVPTPAAPTPPADAPVPAVPPLGEVAEPVPPVVWLGPLQGPGLWIGPVRAALPRQAGQPAAAPEEPPATS